ncbi:MAG: hypothetical protein GVX96_06130 [Bacteroidetes bacterium]|jgi:polysaccharide export outer membrane protein|nr:hypothetical protein [Bacteroidota bacterium]
MFNTPLKPVAFSLLIILLLSLASCVKFDQLVNYRQGDPLPMGTLEVDAPPAFTVQSDDILQIQVTSSNMELAAPYNPMMPAGAGGMAGAQMARGGDVTGPMSYLVTKNGNILFPKFGKIQVSGLTTQQVTDTLTALLKPALNDVVVKVRVLNFRITVTGEVRRPGPVTVPEESLNVLEAIGMAGDFTELANRQNVLIIREVAGQRNFARLNMLSSEVFFSPYYYLQQGDIIYVEPLREKSGILSNEARAAFSIIGGVSSVISLIVTIVAVSGGI